MTYSCILSPLHCRENGRVIQKVAGAAVTFRDILDFLPELNIHGFRCYGRCAISEAEHQELRAEMLNPGALGGLSQANVKQLKGWLFAFNHSPKWKQDSYSLKHTFERETGTYMMNGAFIVCVLMAGFEIKIDGPSALMKMQRPAL
jgi:hypothetical protein